MINDHCGNEFDFPPVFLLFILWWREGTGLSLHWAEYRPTVYSCAQEEEYTVDFMQRTSNTESRHSLSMFISGEHMKQEGNCGTGRHRLSTDASTSTGREWLRV